ncbi:MAG: hypothetical protein UHS51_00915, partial [Atopobiaceae bacterium]|nr:hypothetical protein [Atopobiaceae bacterium]
LRTVASASLSESLCEQTAYLATHKSASRSFGLKLQMALAGIGHRMADEETSQKLWNLLSRPIPHRIASGHVL